MTKKKSLQKFTDIDKLDTLKDIKGFVKSNPKRVDEVINKLQVLLNESYNEKANPIFCNCRHDIFSLCKSK